MWTVVGAISGLAKVAAKDATGSFSRRSRAPDQTNEMTTYSAYNGSTVNVDDVQV